MSETEERVSKAARVYATQPPRWNQSVVAANRFGRVRFLFEAAKEHEDEEKGWEENFDWAFRRLEHKLENYDPEVDWFLPLGEQLLSLLSAIYITHLVGGRFRMLVWNHHEKDYESVEVDVEQYFDDDGDEDDDEDDDEGDERGGPAGPAGKLRREARGSGGTGGALQRADPAGGRRRGGGGERAGQGDRGRTAG